MHVGGIHRTVIDADGVEVYVRSIRSDRNFTPGSGLYRVGQQVGELARFHTVDIQVDEIEVIRIAVQNVGVLLRADDQREAYAHSVVRVDGLHVGVVLAAGGEHDG